MRSSYISSVTRAFSWEKSPVKVEMYVRLVWWEDWEGSSVVPYAICGNHPPSSIVNS